jgi:serine carboxypeptidase-like clade 4
MFRLLFISALILTVVLSEHLGYGPDKVQQYSGYITVNGSQHDSGTHIFYWFFECRHNPKTAPFVIWLTGGPGCSSLTALFYENGPYVIDSNLNLQLNPSSWNEVANIMWIDQPVGTGFSYDDNHEDDRFDEDGVADDIYEFLVNFFDLHPEYKNLDFFITGESYAGHYIPAISARIVQGNKDGGRTKVNLKGSAIGNGWVDPYVQYNAYAALLQVKGLIDPVLAWTYNYTLLPACHALIVSGAWEAAVIECNLAIEALLAAAELENGRTINVYDVRIPCEVEPLCYDLSAAETFLNQAEVKKAIGASPDIEYESCNQLVHMEMLGDWVGNFDIDIPILLDAGVRVLVYSGTEDFICNYLGSQAWVNALSWSGQAQFNKLDLKEWKVDNKTTAGLAKYFGGFTFLEVFNAGHMVPMDQPVNALDMLRRFIYNQPYTN